MLAFAATQQVSSGNVSLSSGSEGVMTFSQFDAATYGTLTGIDIEFYYTNPDFSYTYTATVDSVKVGSEFYADVSNLSGWGSDAATALAVTNSLSGINLSSLSISQGNFKNLTTLASGSSVTYNYTGLTSTTGANSIASTYWTTYTGTDSVFIDATAIYGLYQNIQGNNVSQSGTISIGEIYGVISYSYTPVPEPSTYALFLGVGTLGLVGWRRFRRR